MRQILGDFLGVICLFAMLYGGLHLAAAFDPTLAP